jgi:hypothetical protein
MYSQNREIFVNYSANYFYIIALTPEIKFLRVPADFTTGQKKSADLFEALISKKID